jgi:hypothetical protein
MWYTNFLFQKNLNKKPPKKFISFIYFPHKKIYSFHFKTPSSKKETEGKTKFGSRIITRTFSQPNFFYTTFFIKQNRKTEFFSIFIYFFCTEFLSTRYTK